jgi:hypothetical protein
LVAALTRQTIKNCKANSTRVYIGGELRPPEYDGLVTSPSSIRTAIPRRRAEKALQERFAHPLREF